MEYQCRSMPHSCVSSQNKMRSLNFSSHFFAGISVSCHSFWQGDRGGFNREEAGCGGALRDTRDEMLIWHRFLKNGHLWRVFAARLAPAKIAKSRA